MKKKLVCALLCTAMAAASLTGCGSTGDDNQAKDDNTANDASDDASDDNSADAPDDSAKGDSQTGSGKVYYLNFKPEQGQDWVDLAAKYTEETGVPVDVQTAAAGTYEEQLKSEMAKTEAPTLFR